MRHILAPLGPAGIALPSTTMLDGARDLSRRFPDARLRPVSVARAAELDARADPTGATRVWLALETLQVTGSFKVRGALGALSVLAAQGVRAVAASAGNHGAGVAYAARVLGVPATVVVPESAPLAKRSKIERYGAEIVLSRSPHYDDAEAIAMDLAARPGCAFVSPYDDLDVLTGNGASLGFEIVRAIRGVPEATLAPFGGGGLATGLACAFADESGESLETARSVWGVQSEASCAMALSLAQGKAVTRLLLDGDTETLAEGLEGGISESGFARARAAVAGVVVVHEAQIAHAMAYAHRELGMIIEGSAATALVPLLYGLPEPLRGGDVVAILTGRNVDAARIDRILQEEKQKKEKDEPSRK